MPIIINGNIGAGFVVANTRNSTQIESSNADTNANQIQSKTKGDPAKAQIQSAANSANQDTYSTGSSFDVLVGGPVAPVSTVATTTVQTSDAVSGSASTQGSIQSPNGSTQTQAALGTNNSLPPVNDTSNALNYASGNSAATLTSLAGTNSTANKGASINTSLGSNVSSARDYTLSQGFVVGGGGSILFSSNTVNQSGANNTAANIIAAMKSRRAGSSQVNTNAATGRSVSVNNTTTAVLTVT